MSSRAPFSEADLRAAIAASECWADVCRFLGYGIKGDNYRTIQRWTKQWGISTAHFDPSVRTSRSAFTRRSPLEQILVEHSTHFRKDVKRRLLAAGLKQPICELCGQGEVWRGARMSMVLDHINGVPDDNRLENLRMLCPNCNATLDTHCGRNTPRQRVCPACGQMFVPSSHVHRYCSAKCWGKIAANKYRGVSRPSTRKVERPTHEQLLKDLAELSMVKVGTKYGVSDNAVRKWLRWYENEAVRNAVEAATDDTDQELAA